MRITEYVACMESIRNVYRIIVGKYERKDHFRNTQVDGMEVY
jgi:hypothetical protein